MALKFYLNKFLKVDNIEEYSLPVLKELKEQYDNFLEESEGTDPDFPLMSFGNKGTKIGGKNIYQLLDENESIEDFKRDRLGLPNFGDSDFKGRPELAPDEARKLTRQARDIQNKNNR